MNGQSVLEGVRPVAETRPAAGWARAVVRAGWFGVGPLVATWAFWRWLVPPRSDIGPGAWGWLALQAALHPRALAVGAFLLFALVARAWRDRLPFGARWLSPAAAAPTTLPQRITVGAGLLLAVLGAATARARLGQLYEVSGPSMLPTLQPGDTLVVGKPGRAPLRRGDIVAFEAHTLTGADGDERLVKRVIGLPGDRVRLRAGIPSINGWEVPHCDAGTYVRYSGDGGTVVGRLLVEFLEDRAFLAVHVPGTKSFPGYDVRPGEVFVLGDDRANSDDSRAWNDGHGAGVPLASIEGRLWRVIGGDGDGRTDLHRLLERPGLEPNHRGVDTRDLAAGVARCLAERPGETWPPQPGAS
jgi:signal peptidase I